MALYQYGNFFLMALLIVIMALSWWAYTVGDYCYKSFGDYILTVAITSTIELILVVLVFVLGVYEMITVKLFRIVNWASLLLDFLWLIWGIVELSIHTCKGSAHYIAAIVIVVFTFIILISRFFIHRGGNELGRTGF